VDSIFDTATILERIHARTLNFAGDMNKKTVRSVNRKERPLV
jgi:hypothetical protein